jgi:leukotriene-A4 hydrolase
MSALLETKTTSTQNDGRTKYTWNQPVPISSYLLAVAVGELVKKDISDRCAIWSEPSVVDAAAFEFAETETFLKTAEDISGMKYVWKRYDLLCLPPSFPYGGMENPCLTFVTPTLLAGDRSLADVVAHEIAHSWTGNLVTNKTWDDFFLNEGWTTWFQRKIMARVKNNPKFLDFDAIGRRKDMQDTVDEMDPKDTTLVLDIGDDDPDGKCLCGDVPCVVFEVWRSLMKI